MSANSRLHKELIRIKRERVPGVLITSSVDSITSWHAQIEGPEGSPYEGGLFEMTMTYPKEYPFKAPTVKFLTKVFHPNIYVSGDICLDILQDAWQPTYTGEKVLLSIQSLLTDPNPASSANGRAGTMYEKDRRAYETEARKMTKKHAMEAGSKKRKLEAEGEYEAKRNDGKRKKVDEPGRAAKKAKTETGNIDASVERQKSADELLIEEMQAEGCKNTTLLRQLLPIVGGDKVLLKSLYDGQNS